MKNVLQDALSLAFLAGKQAQCAEETDDPGLRNEYRARADSLMRDAWSKLATLPGETGDDARAECARMTG